jgi:lipoprotein-anchoring transpeptidase ErfK/SrfK
MIIISIADQMLYHRRQTGVWHEYPVSTAAAGAGNERGSFRTPLGRHRIYKKIGAGMARLTAFRGRCPIGRYRPGIDNPNRDWILSRILWLDGCAPGHNRRGAVDTRSRYIYIHGTHEEERLGQPASHGCIRMANDDIMELFEHAREGERVYIRRA